ncbi:hypothetical protein DICVIV_06522 [Dictyocaulus viviparus]|uniref:Uncharacterized protein n=1 Tax=Dictyocaulus viviparus TaxID=29172 RepID=A0A0D8XYG5_DICVI|nr:hypothetical protein DICVIV_06522 [Dictyocaulus viviparus]
MKLLIEAASSPAPVTKSLVICVFLFLCGEIKSILLGIHNYVVVRDASTALSLIINSISKKSLRLASWSRVEWPSARVVNLVAVDAEALAAAAPFAHYVWAAVLESHHAFIRLSLARDSAYTKLDKSGGADTSCVQMMTVRHEI